MEMSKEKHLNRTTGDGVIDLSGKRLLNFPSELLLQSDTKFCYLGGNDLSHLPSTFFRDFPKLEWLDLRNNCLEELPIIGLAGHNCLQVLLLQSNRIKNLPTELANVPHLKGLQISGNPIENIPFSVIASGFQSVINFLRNLEEHPDLNLPVSETFITKPIEKRKPKKSKNERQQSKTTKSSTTTPSFKSQASHRSSLMWGAMNTEEKIAAREKEDRQLAMLRETLQRQSALLQRIKDEEAVKTWRKMYRSDSKKKFLDNFQYSPSRNYLNKTPFDVDEDMMQMLNRADLYKTLKELDTKSRKATKRRAKNYDETVRDIQAQIDAIQNKLDAINFGQQINDKSDFQGEKYYLTTRMDEINKLRDQLKQLHGLNLI